MQKENTTRYDYNPNFLTKDGEAWFPIMGEMHYSRYPRKYWKDSLYKMKAGGVDVVSTYVLWIHHEEVQGEYEFDGEKDLRYFTKCCKECGLSMFLRIGPWCHAETRNGGLPDWMIKNSFEVRTNDKLYLEEVEKYYTKIYEQVEGLFLKDGGPIIGIQIENEYGHCGGLNGEDGEEHMRILTRMAKEIGFDAPLYTATGWGGAVTGGLLPVMGGYCEAPWDQSLSELSPSGNYIFTHERNDHNIGSDYGFGEGITFDLNKFPYLTAELGGGLQVTHHRRPVAYAEDIGAMSMVKLGSGVNLLGYYMYHGGTNPKGKKTTLQESRESGYLNDLPVLNYDFSAPIRQHGQISETYKEIKLLAMFLKDFGGEFCHMTANIPNDNPLNPENLEGLRTSCRHNGKKGYLFVNNYQRRYVMKEHNEVSLYVNLPEETIDFPEVDIKNKDYFFYPFNMEIGKAVLKTALATPLCRLHNEKETYVFYTNTKPCYDLTGDMNGAEIITLTREEAKNAWKICCGDAMQEHLFISDSAVISLENEIELIGRKMPKVKVYPPLKEAPKGFITCKEEQGFGVYEKEISLKEADVTYTLKESKAEYQLYEVLLDTPKEIADCFLRIDYAGDKAEAYIEDEMITDHFYTGQTWEIGLRSFDFPKKLMLRIYPLEENAAVFLEKWPDGKAKSYASIEKAALEIEYRTILE